MLETSLSQNGASFSKPTNLPSFPAVHKDVPLICDSVACPELLLKNHSLNSLKFEGFDNPLMACYALLGSRTSFAKEL